MSFQGRGSLKHMLAVAKKKPALQYVIDNIDSYTTEELTTIPGQPSWVRRHLVTHKRTLEKRAAGYLTPDEIAEIMIDKSNR